MQRLCNISIPIPARQNKLSNLMTFIYWKLTNNALNQLKHSQGMYTLY